MVNYQNSSIYRMVCNVTGLQYIGSTTQPLHKRKHGHLGQYTAWKNGKKNYMTSFKVIENGDFDVVLLEKLECETKEQLHARERYYIETLECVNKFIPARTNKEYYQANIEDFHEKQRKYRAAHVEEMKEYQKTYRAEHKEEAKSYLKEYHIKNADKIREQKRAYNAANAEAIRQRTKKYREANAEKIKAQKSAKVTCECGLLLRHDSMPNHQKSMKHQAWVAQQQTTGETNII